MDQIGLSNNTITLINSTTDRTPSPDAIVAQWANFLCYQLLGFPISVFGVFGNVMSIWVWTRQSMQWGTSSTSCYLVTLSCSDMFYLLTTNLGLLLPNWMRYTQDGFQPLFTAPAQKLVVKSVFTPIVDTLSNVSFYLVVAFTVERWIAVNYPILSLAICRPQRARYIILCVIAAVIVLHIPEYIENVPALQKRGYSESKGYNIGYNWGVMVLFFAVTPLALLSVFNTLLVREVLLSKRSRANLTQANKDNAYMAVTITIILVVVLSFICHTPAATILVVFTYREQRQLITAQEKSKWKVAFAIANLLSIINSSVNFLLYSAFSAKFRITCCKLICPKLYKHDRQNGVKFNRDATIVTTALKSKPSSSIQSNAQSIPLLHQNGTDTDAQKD